ncbi:hypothetical protein NP603_00645 [Methylomonas sp. SURF-1]|uniref:Uncharacterized protein n=1 Tax=Methylomonas aurea TaxID=2952224 RepID=A0ABT1UDV4_9GAMM|nr:hypothetical protein [Methylomonas sp. SURF-1]MCQ8179601.1 hypothetical protein [Methylomonas sp. SURF-1]
MNEKLFGDIFEMPKIRTPKIVLDEFGEKLEQESKGVLTGEIRRIKTQMDSTFAFGFAVKSNHTNYSYNLFSTFYTILLYPCIISSESLILAESGLEKLLGNHEFNGFPLIGVSAKTETELVDYITKILKTDRAISIVRAIYSQE